MDRLQDGSSNNTESEVEFIIESDEELIVEVSFHLEFLTTNN